MTEEEKLAYLAGVIDGEGTIVIGKSRQKKTDDTYFLVLNITNTDIRLMEWLNKEFGVHSLKAKKKQKSNWKTCYRWVVTGKDAYKLLMKVRPYLRLKGEQADVGIEFIYKYQRTVWKAMRPRPNWVKAGSERSYLKMRELNKRGSEKKV